MAVSAAAQLVVKAHFNQKFRFNEKNELSDRYVKFNLQELIKVAVKTCNGAQSCATLSL